MRALLMLSVCLWACGEEKVAGLPDAPLLPPDGPAADPDSPPPDGPEQPQSFDPTGGETTPGEHGGPGCPDTDETVFAIADGAATSHTFSGTVTDAVGNGIFYVKGTGNQELFGTIPTDAGGLYNVTVPLFCGAQQVKLYWENATCDYAIVYDVTTDVCDEPDIRITMGWDGIGIDWELHLIKPGGRINDNATDCTWTSCIGIAPDWGVIGDPTDDPSKDVDNTGFFGPENIVLRNPEAGTYTVMVEHWNISGDPLSDGTVILNVNGAPIVVNSYTDLAPFHVWTVATITYPGGTVTTSQDDYDCTANWVDGCLDPIP